MHRVLIIAYYFPPNPAIGSVRLGGLAKYLPKLGWAPIILTPSFSRRPNSSVRILETKNNDMHKWLKNRMNLEPRSQEGEKEDSIRSKRLKDYVIPKLVNCAGEFLSYPDGQKSWRPFAIETAMNMLRNENIDALLSSSSPVTTHLIAHDLKSKYGIPWVADFRDPWTQNPYYPYSKMRKWVERRLELKTLSQSDALVTTSDPWAKDLRALHSGKHVYTIQNGFDPEEVKRETVGPAFTITYAGALYNGRRDPALLFECLQEMISDGKLDPNVVKVDFYGKKEYWLENLISKHKLQGIVRQHGVTSREHSLRIQRQSQILLLLNWNQPNEKGVYTGKVYEYLAARRPILSIGAPPGSVIIDLLEKTHAGVHGYDLANLKDHLMKFYNEFKVNGQISYCGKIDEINKYSHLEMAKKFASVLDQVVSPDSRNSGLSSEGAIC